VVVAGERNSQAEVQGVELRREEEKKNHEGTEPCFLFPNKSLFERGASFYPSQTLMYVCPTCHSPLQHSLIEVPVANRRPVKAMERYI
jgi:hypothetical protein